METIWKIVIVAGMVSVAIFMQVLSCFAFGNNWLPLIILAPMLLTPVPMLLVNMCSADDAFSETPAGLHWAEFFSAFFFTGCFAIPILLVLTDSVQLGAALTSLGGVLILCALYGLRAYVHARESGMLRDSLMG
mmetsp:Transcript_12133/g.24658  ORF Transcript_12133/g.24658 Transcript_12133/m.24658 type:complete len:134 (+) Transcript_12133:42-443(+)